MGDFDPIERQPTVKVTDGTDELAINADGSLNAVTLAGSVTKATLDTDNISGDAFGRLRVSAPETLFDSKQLFDNQSLFWDELLETGAGIASAYSANTASTVLTSTLNTAGKFVRQTYQSFNYQPGKSQLILQTGILKRNAGGTGVQRSMGYFNDNNGLFLRDNAGTVEVVRRTNVTGTPADNAVAQSAWNIDVMDGSGVSGIAIDWSKTQIFVRDFEWLGVGRVRLALNVDGVTYPVHQFLNANALDKVYMSTPNLPLRYEMITTASSPVSTMECICASVISVGGSQDLGFTRYSSTAGAAVTCSTENVIYAIIGLRLKAAYIGSVIKMLNANIQIQSASETGEWLMLLNPTVASTFTYADITNSALQRALGATANTVTGGTLVGGGFGGSVGNSAGAQGDLGANLDSSRYLGATINGTVDTIVLCWMPNGGTTAHEVEGSLTWREL